jgi:hypothetical protein
LDYEEQDDLGDFDEKRCQIFWLYICCLLFHILKLK